MVDLLLLTWCNVTYVYLHIQMIWRSRYIMLLSFSRSRDYPLVGNTAQALVALNNIDRNKKNRNIILKSRKKDKLKSLALKYFVLVPINLEI